MKVLPQPAITSSDFMYMYIGYIHVGGYNVYVNIEDETFSVK